MVDAIVDQDGDFSAIEVTAEDVGFFPELSGQIGETVWIR